MFLSRWARTLLGCLDYMQVYTYEHLARAVNGSKSRSLILVH